VHADVITGWNDVLCQAIKADPGSANPGMSSRNMAMMNSAMFDAVNSVDQNYHPYLIQPQVAAGTSAEAAAAQAAYTVLTDLYPQQKATFDAALASSLGAVANGAGKTAGISLGNTVGTAIFNSRANDHAYDIFPYTPGNAPGQWQPDPMNPNQKAWGPGWNQVPTFAIPSSSAFPVPPPPALNSPEYAAAFNQVKSLGALNSLTRTQDQANAGQFWAYDRANMGPPLILYDEILHTIATQQGNTLAQNARMYALASLAMADAGIASWDVKFKDDFWRPITAIRNADPTTNPLTLPDPNWQPLGAPGDGVVPNFTPPFPAYVSGHATFGGAMFTMLAHFYGTDKIAFTFTSDELPGQPRTFSSLAQASLENAMSRVYLGIHWKFDADQGILLGNNIADYVFANSLTAVPEPSTMVLLALGLAGLLLKPMARKIRSSVG